MRLPNVIIGTLAVLAVYLLGNEIVKKKYTKWSLAFGILPAFLLAVNPWAIMMSRGAFEANLITFFLPAGIYFFLKGLGNSRFFIWSAILLGLGLFTYHSATLITPIVIFGLIIIFWKKIKAISFRKIVVPLVVLLVFISLAAYAFSTGGGSRVSERSITQGALEEGAGEKIGAIAIGVNPTLARILHNKYQIIAQRFVNNYLQYFSFKFLITQGSLDSYYGMFPGIGVIYIFDGILLIGLVPYLLMKGSNKLILPVIAWFLIAPLPAALSTGAGYSGNRAEGMIPVLQILEAFGFLGWLGLLNKLSRKTFPYFLILIGVLLIWNLAGFVKSYTREIPQSAYTQMLDGNLAAANWINQNEKGKNVIVSRSFSEPQIFFAFANAWDPKSYQNYAKGWHLEAENVVWLDQLSEYRLGNYTFKSVDWKNDIQNGVVIVARPEDFPKVTKPDKIFYYGNGTPSLYVKNY